MAASYSDAIFLLGDSLTQAWGPGSLAQRMSEHWLRRLDVLNRGYGGYNSVMGVEAFKRSFGTAADRAAGRAQKIPLMTLWYGANDSVLEGRPQHVSENDYGMHLADILQMVTSEDSEWYSPETKIILIGVTPIVEEDRHKGQLARWREFGCKGAEPTLDRDIRHTQEYRDTPGMLLHVCFEDDEPPIVPLDAWGAIERAAGGCEPDQLRPFFYDGLHLTAKGYEVIFNEIVKIVDEHWPELKPENLPMCLPHWSDIDVDNVEASMAPKPKADAGAKHGREEEDADVEQQKKAKN